MAGRLPHGSRVLALLALLAGLLAAGCGASGVSGTSAPAGPDPATVAPPTAALYGQAVVKPSGDMKDGVVAAARKVLLVQDPGAELRRLLDKDQSDRTSFSRDYEPWLGSRVGGFVLMPARGLGDPDAALALAIADRGAFDAAHARMRRVGAQHPAGSYRGVAYDRDRADGTYTAPIGDFYVGGTLAGLRAAIDASKGDSLADSTRFKDATSAVPADALASFYVDPRAIAGGLRHLPGDASAAAHSALARLADADPATASLTVSADRIAIEADADASLLGGAGGGSDAQVSVGQLPGDAWLALATPPLGPLLRQLLDATGVHDQAAAAVRRGTGLDLDRDLLSPLGGLGAFVRGSSPLDVAGGVLLQLTTPAAAQVLLTRLEAIVASGLHVAPQPVTLGGARGFQLQIPQSPQPIVVLAKGDRLAAGYAASSAQDLLAPQQRFDESGAGKRAIATLGDGWTPSFVLLVPQLTALLSSLDELQIADLSSVLPYLRAYRSLAVGTKRDGDRVSARVVADLR